MTNVSPSKGFGIVPFTHTFESLGTTNNTAMVEEGLGRLDLRPCSSSQPDVIEPDMDQSMDSRSGGNGFKRRGNVKGHDSHSELKYTPEEDSVKKTPIEQQQQDEKQLSRRDGTPSNKVSFQVDDKDKIVESVHEYPYEPDMVDEEIWWTDDELDKLLTEAMLVADHFTRKRKDWQDNIIAMLKQCKQTDKKMPLKASDLEFVVDSEARGLELYIHPVFQKSREKAIKSVVAVQKQIAVREAEKGPDPEFRLNAIKNKSMKLTQPARLMAKTLAAGDARAAAKGDTEDDKAIQQEES